MREKVEKARAARAEIDFDSDTPVGEHEFVRLLMEQFPGSELRDIPGVP